MSNKNKFQAPRKRLTNATARELTDCLANIKAGIEPSATTQTSSAMPSLSELIPLVTSRRDGQNRKLDLNLKVIPGKLAVINGRLEFDIWPISHQFHLTDIPQQHVSEYAESGTVGPRRYETDYWRTCESPTLPATFQHEGGRDFEEAASELGMSVEDLLERWAQGIHDDGSLRIPARDTKELKYALPKIYRRAKDILDMAQTSHVVPNP